MEASNANFAVINKGASPRDPEFQLQLKKLAAINSRLSELCSVSGTAADKIVGSQPMSTGGAGNGTKLDSIPNGCLTELSRTLDATNEMVERVYGYVSRITNEF